MAKNSISVQSIDSFGQVAAEDDPIGDYFVTTETHSRVSSGEVLLVLGRKGSGKTALVKNFSEQGKGKPVSASVSFRSYPWKLHEQRIDAGAAATEAYTASWEFLLAVEAAKLALRRSPKADTPAAKLLKVFFKANYGSEQPESSDILRPDSMSLGGALEPTVLGCKLGSLSWKRAKGDFSLKSDATAVSSALLDAAHSLLPPRQTGNTLLIHLDELDQGLNIFDDARRAMITGLVLAARNIRNRTAAGEARICPVVYLRTDLWEQLRFSDKNKITQTYTARIEWTEQELQQLIDRRASVRLGETVTWDDLDDGQLMRGSQTKWRHIVSRTYLRPRDVIRFCNELLVHAKHRGLTARVFENDDINRAKEAYSNYLKTELDDEIQPHWSNWHVAADALSAIETVTFRHEEFCTEYNKRTSADCPPAETALERLFDFSVIGWERRIHSGGSAWAFKYDSSDVRWDPTASRFKTHPGLKEYLRLKEERQQ